MTVEAPRAPLLLVDDNETFVDIATRLLASGDPPFAVSSVDTGARALAFLHRRPPYEAVSVPAVMVLDFHLPDVKAPWVLGRMRRDPMLARLPVLVMSAANWPDDAAAALAAGATAFRTKPGDVGLLHRIVVAFWRDHAERCWAPAH